MGVLGESIRAARMYACFCTAVSASLVGLIVWRGTRSRWATLCAMVLFIGNPHIFFYSGFAFNDTIGLTWSLLLIALFRPAFESRRRLVLVGYSLLSGIGVLLSWQCCMASAGCVAALLISNPRAFRERYVAALLPVGIVFVVGVSLIAWMGTIDSRCRLQEGEKPQWQTKLALRTGLAEPALLPTICTEHLLGLARNPQFFLLFFFLLLNAAIARYPPRQAEVLGEEWPDGPFYLLALLLFPVLWLVAMPDMHRHDFQQIFSAPLVAVGIASILRVAAKVHSHRARVRFQAATLVAAVVLVFVSAYTAKTLRKEVSPFYGQLVSDLRSVAGTEIPAVVALEHRGVWWLLDRPVVPSAGIDVLEKAGADYVVIDWEGCPEYPANKYELLLQRNGFLTPYTGYKIFRRVYEKAIDH